MGPTWLGDSERGPLWRDLEKDHVLAAGSVHTTGKSWFQLP